MDCYAQSQKRQTQSHTTRKQCTDIYAELQTKLDLLFVTSDAAMIIILCP